MSLGVFKSSLKKGKSPSLFSLRTLLLKLLRLLLTVEGKHCSNGGGLSEARREKPMTRHRLTHLLDNRKNSAQEQGVEF